ncbi:MAG TPA: hypothetical protein VFY29_09215 [Terriglobia bacterium]|nr:hypothetical protein [Terriglobia bacterium]
MTVSLLSIVCFLYTVFLGFGIHDHTGVGWHIEMGMAATFLVVFAQSMTMFFFIGTGKQVKDLVINTPMANEFIPRTKRFKARVFPPALWAMLLTMATMILGGGVHTRVLPAWIHWGLAAGALYYNLVAFWRDAKYMLEHNLLMEELESRLPPPAK